MAEFTQAYFYALILLFELINTFKIWTLADFLSLRASSAFVLILLNFSQQPESLNSSLKSVLLI